MADSFAIEPAEMQQLVETLGAIGEQPGGGIIRHVYDPAWVASRQHLADWMREAGLAVRALGAAGGRPASRGSAGRVGVPPGVHKRGGVGGRPVGVAFP